MSYAEATTTDHAKKAVSWAAQTLAARGYTLYPIHGGWDVESPTGSWHPANNWRELCDIAHLAMKAV